jgi:hypothetical protein
VQYKDVENVLSDLASLLVAQYLRQATLIPTVSRASKISHRWIRIIPV